MVSAEILVVLREAGCAAPGAPPLSGPLVAGEEEFVAAVNSLYARFAAELATFTQAFSLHAGARAGRSLGVGLSDHEGELLYMLVRELRPRTVFEISPWRGWSTNHLLAAVTKNGYGHLHSF